MVDGLPKILVADPQAYLAVAKPARQFSHAMQILKHIIHFFRNWLFSRSVNTKILA